MDEKYENARVRARVSGFVQGVGYRYFCKRNAEHLGIKGYAKNMTDGSVEVVGEGGKSHLLLFLDALKSGPSLSDVKSVDAVWEKPEGKLTFFRVI